VHAFATQYADGFSEDLGAVVQVNRRVAQQSGGQPGL
jgi:hypothetical protein